MAMSSAKALLERAALCTEAYVVDERKLRAIKLLALHIIRLCDKADVGEETRLLIELLDEKP